MAHKVFIDTNVFAYAADDREPTKRARAWTLLRQVSASGHGVVSAQVMGEFYVVATGKLRLAPPDAQTMLSAMAQNEVVGVDAALVNAAIDCALAHQLSYWDALIIVAAERARCRVLYSEDLNHGQAIRGLRIVNPFVE